MILGNKIGVQHSSDSLSSYWTTLYGQSDLNVWVKSGTRNGLSIPNSLGGNPVSIKLPSFKAVDNTENFTLGAAKNIGKVHTVYFRAKMKNDNFNGILLNSALSSYLFEPVLTGRQWYYNVNGAYVNSATNTIPAAYFTDNTFHDFCIVRNQTAVSAYIDGVQIGTTQTFAANTDFIFDSMFKGQYNFGSLTECKIYSTVQTPANAKAGTPDLSWFIFTGFICTDVIGGEVLLLANGNDFDNAVYSDEGSQYLLANGYDIYRKVAGVPMKRDVYVPHKTDGVSCTLGNLITQRSYSLTSKKSSTGSLTDHNYFDSYLSIPYSNWDRSNTSLWRGSARIATGLGCYDSNNPTWWHASELNKERMMIYSNKNYRNFIKATNNSYESRQSLKEIISYNNNLSVSGIEKVAKYCNDLPAIYMWPTYDEIKSNGMFACAIPYDSATGTYHMYFMYGASPNYSIYHATSPDGITWTDDAAHNPVMAGSGGTTNWDAKEVWVPKVWKEGSTVYMIYGGDNTPTSEEQIGLATAPDWSGPFTRYVNNPVYPFGVDGAWDGADHTNALDPYEIIKVGSMYYMYITTIKSNGPRTIGLVTSPDLINWTKVANNPIFSDPIISYYCPTVFKYNGYFWAIITKRDSKFGEIDILELWRCPNPTFYPNERTLIKTIVTEQSTGSGLGRPVTTLDSPIVVCNDINRDSFPTEGEMSLYFSPTSGSVVYMALVDNLELAFKIPKT